MSERQERFMYGRGGTVIVDGDRYVPAAEVTRLQEALRELYDGAVAKGPSSIPAFKKAREALGDTPDKCPICGLPTTAGPYQCMGHLGDTPDERQE